MSDLAFTTIRDRLARLRAKRRRIGWFDYSSDSYDMKSTAARAMRIFARLNGERAPLECICSGRALPWNSYHH